MDLVMVSIILPIYNGEQWIDECFDGILKQVIDDFRIEICVYNDCSTDNTLKKLNDIKTKLRECDGIELKIISGTGVSKGVGFAKNRAVEQSCGSFLCFQDVDDVMYSRRICLQLALARKNLNAIVGCKFRREPEGSTARFTRWANSIEENLLTVQVFTSHGPTVVMPTWFCSRQVYDRVGGFNEEGAGTPEDLIFFYNHLDTGGEVKRVNEELLLYRYHPLATTHSILEDTIWDIRIKRLEEKILPDWRTFTIWNAGKQGKKLYRSMKSSNQTKVQQFSDVDINKIGKYYEPYSPETRMAKKRIPILHFRDCQPPFVICVKLDMTNGVFEENLRSLDLKEGHDYVLFS